MSPWCEPLLLTCRGSLSRRTSAVVRSALIYWRTKFTHLSGASSFTCATSCFTCNHERWDASRAVLFNHVKTEKKITLMHVVRVSSARSFGSLNEATRTHVDDAQTINWLFETFGWTGCLEMSSATFSRPVLMFVEPEGDEFCTVTVACRATMDEFQWPVKYPFNALKYSLFSLLYQCRCALLSL